MTSLKACNRLRLYNTIVRDGDPAVTACLLCSSLSVACVRMENHPKCAECVRRGRPCVGASWESLDRTRDKLESDLSLAEEELARALAKVARLRKTLSHTKSKVDEKALCLAQELSADNDGTEDEVLPDLSQFMKGLPDDFWRSVASPSALVGSPSGVVGSSQGS